VVTLKFRLIDLNQDRLKNLNDLVTAQFDAGHLNKFFMAAAGKSETKIGGGVVRETSLG
jgi:hypothetical protein